MASKKPHVQIRRIYEDPPRRRHQDAGRQNLAEGDVDFTRRYEAELTDPERAAALAHLRELAHRQMLTLLTATKDVDISEAAVLAELVIR